MCKYVSNSFSGENAEYDEADKSAELPTHFTFPFSNTTTKSAQDIAWGVKKHKTNFIYILTAINHTNLARLTSEN